VPEGRSRTYGLLLFFLPALVFWDSSIGKEAWMVFALGIAAHGAAKALTGRIVRGLVGTAVGLGLASLVRPHVAMLFAVAFAVAFLLKRPQPEHKELGPIFKFFALIPVVLMAVYLVQHTNGYLKTQHLGSNVTSVATNVTGRTLEGGSSFRAPSILRKPAKAPSAIATVLFRPFPWETHNSQQLLASLERVFLLAFAIVRRRWLWAALKSMRRQPYLILALGYTLLFVVGFSSVANFGILNRQSVQMIPMALVLLAVPPKPRPERVKPAYRAWSTPQPVGAAP
jgi:hypothetical protein